MAQILPAHVGTGSVNHRIRQNQEIFSGATVILDNLTLANGKPYDSGTCPHGNGGGVNNAGTLTIQDSIIRDNLSAGLGGSPSGCDGGGVYSSSTLTIERSTIRDNIGGEASDAVAGDGGGVYIFSGAATIKNSAITGNSSGVDANSGTSGNGGGVHVQGGTATIENSVISSNTASGEGHGGTPGNGGGVSVQGGIVTIENSTLSGNTAQGKGGGVYTGGGTLTLAHTTITDNTGDSENHYSAVHSGGIHHGGGTVNLKNSIVFGNDDVGETSSEDCAGTIVSQGYNLVGDGTGCPSGGAGDQTTTDAKLGPLQNNGGPTETHALLYDSPAVKVIPSGTNGCGDTYTTDQRGETRPQGGRCDVGAYESAYIVWDGGGGGDTNTATAANWSGDTAPAATDVPVFDDTSSNNATVNNDLTVAGWVIASGYSGTISQGSSDLTVNGDWTQVGGTFSGGSSPLDIDGAFALSGGSFTAPRD